MLPVRKHTILQSLIQEYVISAHPVASSTLARYYVPLLSAATVRNELSWLEDRGYVAQPHTSAGRLPTTVGYRTFVNSLLLYPESRSALVNRSALRYSGRDALDTGRDASSYTAGMGATTMPQQSATLPAVSSLAGAKDKLALISEALEFFAEANQSLMVFWAPHLLHSVIHRGLPLLLCQPEFIETSAALPIMQLLESHGSLMSIFKDIMSVGGLHIKIGSEHKDSQLYEFSLVAKRFDCVNLTFAQQTNQPSHAAKAHTHGVVALFGPTRMDYEGAISAISSLARDLECPPRQGRN